MPMTEQTKKITALLERLPELAGGKVPPVDPALAGEIAESILQGGEPALAALLDGLGAVDDGSDWKARLMLHAVVNLAAGADGAASRETVAGTLLAESAGGRPAGVRVFLLGQLRLLAGADAVPAVVPLLTAVAPGVADAAAAVLVSIGPAALPALRLAHEGAEPRHQEVIGNAIAQVEDR